MITTSISSGGAARYVIETASGLKEKNLDVTLLVADGGNDYLNCQKLRQSRWEKMSSPLELLPGLTDFRHRAAIHAFRKFEQLDFDVLHLNQVSGGWCSFRALHELTQQFPTVWTHHDQWAATNGIACDLSCAISKKEALSQLPFSNRLLRISPYHPSYKSRSLRSVLCRYPPRIDIHVCPSKHLLIDIRKNAIYVRSKFILLRNATSMVDFPGAFEDRVASRNLLNLPTNLPIVLFVSANLMDAHKGLKLAVPAFHRLRNSGHRFRIQLLGKPSPGVHKSLAGLDYQADFVSNTEELLHYYRAASLTIIPSVVDNFPYVAIESLACGTPFVSFAVGGPLEIANEFAGELADSVVAPCYESDGLSDRIATLLDDDGLCRRVGELGRAWVAEHCRYPGMISRLVDVYDSAISAFRDRSQSTAE